MRNTPSFINKSNFYFLVVLVIFGITVAYGIMQYQVMMAMKVAVEDNESRIAQLQEEFRTAEDDYRTLAADFTERHEDFLKKMEKILPPDAGYTDLARLFDNFFAGINRPGNEIEQNNLVFGQPQPLEDMNHISVLPVSMNIKGSRSNFLKFLEFIENSGTLESGTRLMELKSITFNFEDGGELVKDPTQDVTFSVRMNTYFRTSKVAALN
ncbi:hypothetical protein COV82_05680 [Candidatus Peregrinibacteria bacterium CG11_big_fil_rev_8_21_14_0_20_46_8]|nr:MAG: hypothetical protein COV82_05680 [Candidatus Peregrinibacteria bacterium CG11_big_fil_rev_8_21_14_0_20_46_8]